MRNEIIQINNMNEPFILLGDYSVTTQSLVEVDNDEWTENNGKPEMKYENFTNVELSSVYATEDRKYVIHCTQYRSLEGEDGEVPFDDNSEVINCLFHCNLEKIFKQYDSCTIIVSQVYGTTADLTIIPNEVIIDSNELFQCVHGRLLEDPYCKNLIYDKTKNAFVKYDNDHCD